MKQRRLRRFAFEIQPQDLQSSAFEINPHDSQSSASSSRSKRTAGADQDEKKAIVKSRRFSQPVEDDKVKIAQLKDEAKTTNRTLASTRTQNKVLSLKIRFYNLKKS